MFEQCFAKFAERGLLREDVDPAFVSRVVLALVLNHAAGEETVRTMQRDDHDDSSIKDLVRLARSFLTPPRRGY